MFGWRGHIGERMKCPNLISTMDVLRLTSQGLTLPQKTSVLNVELLYDIHDPPEVYHQTNIVNHSLCSLPFWTENTFFIERLQ